MLSERTHQDFPEAAARGFAGGCGGLGRAGSSGRGGAGRRAQGDGRRSALEPVSSTGPPNALLHLLTVRLQETQGHYRDTTHKSKHNLRLFCSPRLHLS